MGFKWFKVRMWMDRSPSQSSTVAGSYRVLSPYDDSVQSYERPKSVPIFNNPVIDSSSVGSKTTAKPINRVGQVQDLTKSLGDLTTVGTVAVAVDLSRDEVEETYNLSAGRSTPKPTGRKPLADFRRKKVKAPAPKTGEKNNSARSNEIITIDGAKTLRNSDIDV